MKRRNMISSFNSIEFNRYPPVGWLRQQARNFLETCRCIAEAEIAFENLHVPKELPEIEKQRRRSAFKDAFPLMSN